MPLAAPPLANALVGRWLGADRPAGHPASVAESAERFAAAVADWFSAAVAAGFPCATAQARRAALVGPVASALAVGHAVQAGQALAAAVAAYLTGHRFGAGTSGPPVALPAAAGALGQALADLDAATDARASRIASALLSLAVSTPVAFPGPPWAGVVM